MINEPIRSLRKNSNSLLWVPRLGTSFKVALAPAIGDSYRLVATLEMVAEIMSKTENDRKKVTGKLIESSSGKKGIETYW